MARNGHETEIKIALSSVAFGERLLRRAGFRVARRKVFEENTVFDTPGRLLRGSGRLLRVRAAGPVSTVTYKGPAAVGRHKSREEVEFETADPTAAATLFERIGFLPMFRYEKYRTEFRMPGGRGGVAMIDHTPVGDFLELEGSPRWIDRTARELGFSTGDYDTRSYGALYLEWCQKKGVRPGHMTFTRRSRPTPARATPKDARKSPRARA